MFSILVFVEEEIVFGRIVGPDFFNALVGFAFIFEFLKVLDHFQRGTGADGVVNQLILGCRLGRVFQMLRKFKGPVHNSRRVKE